MRNVFLFIRRYFNLFFFLFLQVIALWMLFHYNRFHEAAFMGVAMELTGGINSRYNSVETYFSLKKENEKLRDENARLLNRMQEDFAWPDSSTLMISDTTLVDSLEVYRKFQYLPAKVISNTTSSQNNFLVLHRGSMQGVSPNMAVVGPQGIVGTVVNVSRNMSLVMSLLHRQSRVVAVMKKGSGVGELIWDGKDPQYLKVIKIPKTVNIEKGDTVVTSQFSDKYPPGYLIGVVDAVDDEKSTSTYVLRVRSFTNFYNIQHAYIVQNLQLEEQEQLKNSYRQENE